MQIQTAAATCQRMAALSSRSACGNLVAARPRLARGRANLIPIATSITTPTGKRKSKFDTNSNVYNYTYDSNSGNSKSASNSIHQNHDQNENKNVIIVEARKMAGKYLDAIKLTNKLFYFLRPRSKKLQFRQAKAAGRNTAIEKYAHTHARKIISSPSKEMLEDIVSIVSTASNLINFGKTAEVGNGMELLDYLAGPKHSNVECRGRVNALILTGVDPFGSCSEVKHVLYRRAVDNASEGNTHQCAIKILGSALFDSIACAMLTLRDLGYWKPVIPILLEDMNNVEKDPHLACFAVRCLRAWIAANKGCRVVEALDACTLEIDRGEMIALIKRLATFGRQKYANLEMEGILLFRVFGAILFIES